jgi:Glyoxalase-like domain
MADSYPRIAQIDGVQPSTWPDAAVPQVLYLNTVVTTVADLETQKQRALGLGATLRFDRHEDPDEPLYVFADPAGHPFCIFVG